jgi:hypothetical protein
MHLGHLPLEPAPEEVIRLDKGAQPSGMISVLSDNKNERLDARTASHAVITVKLDGRMVVVVQRRPASQQKVVGKTQKTALFRFVFGPRPNHITELRELRNHDPPALLRTTGRINERKFVMVVPRRVDIAVDANNLWKDILSTFVDY